MSQFVDLTQYFTRSQSDARYTRELPLPSVPISPHVSKKGLVLGSEDQYSYLEVTLTDPAPPAGFTFTPGLYVQGYQFTVTYNVGVDEIGNPKTKTITYRILRNPSGVYSLDSLPSGTPVTIQVATVDLKGQYSTFASVSDAIAPVGSTAADTIPPAVPTITAAAISAGCQIKVLVVNTEADFARYELWRGQGFLNTTGVAITDPANWSVTAPIKLLEFNGSSAVDVAIPSTASNYGYYVLACDQSNNKSVSNVAQPGALTSTNVAPPSIPDITGTTATPQADGTILLNYPVTLGGTEALFRIWRKDSIDNYWLVLDTLASSAVSAGHLIYKDVFTIVGHTYQYSLSAVNSAGDDSGYNSTPNISALCTKNPPATVASLTLVGQVGGVLASWPLTSGATQYEVSYRTSQTGSFGSPILVTGVSYIVYGLSATRDSLSNQLEVRVRGYDGSSYSASYTSHVASFSDLAGYQPSDGTIPPAPVLLAPDTSRKDGTIGLSWTAPSIPDLVGYQVEVQSQLNSVLSNWEILTVLNDATSGTKTYSAVGLEPYAFRNKQYRFRIRTIDSSNNISAINMLENPSFGSNTAGVYTYSPWDYNHSFAAPTLLGTSFARNGVADALQSNNQTGVFQNVTGAPIGVNLAASIYACLPAGSTATQAAISISFLNASNTVLRTTTATLAGLNATFQRVKVIDTVPSNTVTTKITLVGDTLHPTQNIIWDDSQLEQNPDATAAADATTQWLRVVDTTGPQNYSTLGLTATPGLGIIQISWNNPAKTDPAAVDYINSNFLIYRSTTSGGTYTKIAEALGTPDGNANKGWTDFDPDENVATTYYYKLAARDSYGNVGPFLNNGNPVSATSLTFNDKNVVDLASVVNQIADIPTPLFDIVTTNIWGSALTAVTSSTPGVPAGAPITTFGKLSDASSLSVRKFTVTPGQKIYMESWIDTTQTSYSAGFGISFTDTSGTVSTVVGCSIAPNQAWQKVTGTLVVPANCILGRWWLEITGPAGSTGNAYFTKLVASTAYSAQVDAINAQSAADSAMSYAVTVNGNVNTINSTLSANGINNTTNVTGSINTLTTNVTTAQNTANNASTNAANALSTANTALTNANNALTTANTAATNASAALSQLSDIASDNLLTPDEKPQIVLSYNTLTSEQSGIDGQATAYGITTEKTSYDNAITTLTNYLATLTSPVLWSNLTDKTNVVGTTFRTNFQNVYTTRQTLLNKIYATAKSLADGAQSTANTAAANASAAQTAAANAQTSANSALSQLSDIVSDNYLTPDEKPSVIVDYNTISNEQAGIDAQATTYSISTEKTNYDNAVSALTTYLGTLTTPVLWSNLTDKTAVVGTTFRQKFLDVYSSRQTLLNKIYATAKSLADSAQSTATDALNLATTVNGNVTTLNNTVTVVQNTANSALATGDNLVPNGDSELGAISGYGGNAVYNTSGQGMRGSNYVRRLTTTTGYATIYLTDVLPCKPGDKFVIESMAKMVSGPGEARVGFRVDSATQQGIQWSTQNVTSATTFTAINAFGTTISGATGVAFYLEMANAGTSEAWWDDIKAYRVQPDAVSALTLANTVNGNVNTINSTLSANGITSSTNITGSVNTINNNVTSVSNATGIPVVLRGTGFNYPSSRIVNFNGTSYVGAYAGFRGLFTFVIRRSDFSFVDSRMYDVFGSQTDRTTMRDWLNSLGNDVLVMITSCDAIGTSDGLDAALNRCGAAVPIITDRCPFAFIGIPGIGKGAGKQVFLASSIQAYADLACNLTNGGVIKDLDNTGAVMSTNVQGNVDTINSTLSGNGITSNTNVGGTVNTLNIQINDSSGNVNIAIAKVNTVITDTATIQLGANGKFKIRVT